MVTEAEADSSSEADLAMVSQSMEAGPIGSQDSLQSDSSLPHPDSVSLVSNSSSSKPGNIEMLIPRDQDQGLCQDFFCAHYIML